MKQPKLLTLQEVSAYLAVTPRTVYRLLKEHRLPAYRVGGLWRFKLEMIEAWMRQERAGVSHQRFRLETSSSDARIFPKELERVG